MNIYKIKEIEEDIHYYADVNKMNAMERSIVLSIVNNSSDEFIYNTLVELSKHCDSGSKDEVSNEQSPKHYKTKYEPIDFITKWELDFSEGSIVKYITRYKSKNGAIDLNKIYFYFIQMKYGEHSRIKNIF